MSDMIFMVGLDYLRLKTDYRFFVQDPSLDAEMDQIAQRFLQRFGVFDEVMDAWDQTPLDFPADLRYEGSLYKLQYILLHRTLWYEVMVPQEQLPDIFSFEGPAPAGVFGETEGSLRASGCRCPSCGKNMYVAKFPHGHREPLHTGYFMNRDLIISESYLCPCGRLFAAPEGRSLTEGPVFAAAPVIATDNPLGRKLFDMWWEYFEMVMQTY